LANSTYYALMVLFSVMWSFNHRFSRVSVRSIGTFGKRAVTSNETKHSSSSIDTNFR
jgi:hypothetical protein